MDSIESLSYFKGRLEPFFSISILIREQMAPKKGTVASKTDFFPFPGKRDIDPGFFRDAPRASLDELERAKFRRAALSRLACRSCTNRQTETKHEINGLLGLGCKASRSLGRGPTSRMTEMRDRSELPVRNSEVISLKDQRRLGSKFPALHNDTKIMELRRTPFELEWP